MTINRYLRYSIITGLFLFPFLAFIVPSSMFFPFITGKNFAFRILVEILIGLFLVLKIRDPQYRPRFSWLFGAFAILLVIIGIADLLSENPFKSFWSNYERMEGFITFLHFFAYFVIASVVLNTEKLWERLFQTTLGASVIMSGYAILQLFGVLQIHQGSTRVDATLGNATYLAIYLVLHIFIALFLYVRSRGALWPRIIYGAVILLEAFILYRTETRGAILGLIGGVLLMALIIGLFEKGNKRVRQISFGIVGLILVFSGLFVALRNEPFIKNTPIISRFASLSFNDPVNKGRFLVWGMALEGFKERPILGWGQESFNYVFNKYYNPEAYAQEQWFDRTHNVILDWLIAGGVVGLLGYLSLYVFALFYIWKRGEFTFRERAVFTGMLAAYFFHNLFVFDNLISLVVFFTFLAYLHSHVSRGKEVLVKRIAPEWLKVSSGPIAAVIVLGLLYFINWNAIAANLTLIKALQSESSAATSLPLFQKALAYNSFGSQEIREQLMQYAVNLRNDTNTSDALKQQAFDLTKSEMLKMIAQSPNDTRHYLFLGTVMDAYGDNTEAGTYLERAHALSPRKQSILFQLGTHYLNVGDVQKALTEFKAAYDLEPNYREAQIIYGLGQIYAGNLPAADQLIGEAGQLDDRVLRAYVETKHFDRALAVEKAKIQASPTDPNLQIQLAAIYYQAGDKANAIAVIQAIVKANPSFKDQGDAYIKQIQAGTVQ